MSSALPAHANSISYRYGKPIIALVLYSSLTMVSLHYVYARLDYEEQLIAAKSRIGALQEKGSLGRWFWNA
ncbi:hypothetical protein BDR26DRAFT_1011812 [Obelidium mucronatum]|nr:hypothetical protein BDR26DRAFT_1011812 [Obelidium mucronatum]